MTDEVIKNFEEQIKSGKKWIIINNSVFDVAEFSKIHPGGSKIISAYIGRDASDVWEVMHPDKELVAKFMKSIKIGVIEKLHKDPNNDGILDDYRQLRKKANSQNLFKTDFKFYFLTFVQIIFFEVLACLVLHLYGVNFSSFLMCAMLIATSQAQAGWVQHDYGHISVFNTNKLNKIAQKFIIGFFKGASSSWWNFRHNLHHSCTNTFKYDPDIGFSYLFVIGSHLPVIWGRKHRGFMPYQHQHSYFLLIMPPLLLPLYFHYENIYFVFKRGKWLDFLFQTGFFLRFFLMFGIYLDSWWSIFALYMLSRFFESYWFTLITQMSHITMESNIDIDIDWFRHQLVTTCNVHSNWFNDWFTGHLNFQIEHHLFPDMPRHNYGKVKADVMKLCEKYNVKYHEKSLSGAIFDIIKSLKSSGELWFEAYNNPG